jgi:hypothetical protein
MAVLESARAHLAQREVEAHREEEQHDADLGELIHLFRRADDGESGRTRQRARADQRNNRRHAQPARGDDDRERDGVDHHEIDEQTVHDCRHQESGIRDQGCLRLQPA